MRTKLFILLVIAAIAFAFSADGYGQFRPSAIKIGYLNPKDAEAGLMLGGDFTFEVDEAVELGLSSNLFYKTYNKSSRVAEQSPSGGIKESEVKKELEYSTLAFPLYAMVNVVLPASRNFGYQLNGGLGYEFLFNKENNFVENKSERRFYKGLTWLASAGFHYRIGSRSAFVGELLYHSAKVKRNQKETPEGLPVWTEVDLSGFGFRFGLHFGVM